MDKYEVIVVGLGAMGSAATYQLAKAGVSVLGIDRYQPPHIYGSSHGDTRVTRLAIGEGAEYVPLVQRSHELWREIERESGYELLVQCGGLIMAVEGGLHSQHGVNNFLKQTISSAEQYGIKHEVLSGEQIKARFPQFNLVSKEAGYYEPEAGFVRPEKCIEAQLELAKKRGADLKFNEKVQSFESADTSVTVQTSKGTYLADKIIISVGPWIGPLVPEYKSLFKIYQQILYWFELKDQASYELYKNMPIYIWEFGGGPDDYIYGFPAIDGLQGGAKVASEDYEVEALPDLDIREVTQAEIDGMYTKYVNDRLPGLTSRCLKAIRCHYTVTPDHKFVIDFHPKMKNVIIASPCSGHGFKHSAAVGEVLCQLATKGNSDIDISKFALARFM